MLKIQSQVTESFFLNKNGELTIFNAYNDWFTIWIGKNDKRFFELGDQIPEEITKNYTCFKRIKLYDGETFYMQM